MRYVGGKGLSFRRIVNLIPHHKTYIETHLGGGAVLRNKRPAANDIGIDVDPAVINAWAKIYGSRYQVLQGDAIAFLERWSFCGDEVIYSDPPYLPSTRRRKRVYRYDYTEGQHERLLEALTNAPCSVLISGYDNALYGCALKQWNSVTFTAASQSGAREEKIWFNFDLKDSLHDPRFLGENFREREVIRRRIKRLRDRIEQLSRPEKALLLELLQSSDQRGQE